MQDHLVFLEYTAGITMFYTKYMEAMHASQFTILPHNN